MRKLVASKLLNLSRLAFDPPVTNNHLVRLSRPSIDPIRSHPVFDPPEPLEPLTNNRPVIDPLQMLELVINKLLVRLSEMLEPVTNRRLVRYSIPPRPRATQSPWLL
jgi:hypothetical protein